MAMPGYNKGSAAKRKKKQAKKKALARQPSATESLARQASATARKATQAALVDAVEQERLGDAMDSLAALPADAPPFDLIFLDADKKRSYDYCDLVLSRGLLAEHVMSSLGKGR